MYRSCSQPSGTSVRRAAALVLPLLAVSCSPAGQEAQQDATENQIACALGSGASWHEDCLLERATEGGISLLVVRHPDGGFRRFRLVGDGPALVEADGAEVLRTRQDGPLVEVTVGSDAYRVPLALLQTRGAAHE